MLNFNVNKEVNYFHPKIITEIIILINLFNSGLLKVILSRNQLAIDRITALWAFSEAALGGILHVLRIPFTGLFIGGSAVIFISLLAYYSDSRNTIIESAVKVILVKFVVSPYTPINAYFAVILQTFLGYILFFKGFNRVSSIVLGFLSLLFSALQKIVVTTLIFGMTLWESIDIFFDFILNKIFSVPPSSEGLFYSYILVITYVLSHVMGGLISGWYAALLPLRIANKEEHLKVKIKNGYDDLFNGNNSKRRKKWWRKPTALFVLGISLILILLSFFYEEVDNQISTQILVMLIRSVVIIITWYYFISPLLLKLLKRYLTERKHRHIEDINRIVEVFPNIRTVIKYSWKEVQSIRGVKKIIIFVDTILISFIILDENFYE